MRSKQSSDLIKLAIACVDFSLISMAFYFAYWLRFDTLEGVGPYAWLYYFSAPIMLILLLRYGVLTGFRFRSLREIFKATLAAFLVSGVVSTTFMYLTKTTDFSRLLFGSYFAFAAIFVVVGKVLLKRLFSRHLRRGGMNVRIAMVGFGKRFDDISAELQCHPEWGVRSVVAFDPRTIDIKYLTDKIRSSFVDEVYICYPRGHHYHQQIDDLLSRLENLGFPVRVALNFDELEDYYGQHPCRMGTKEGVLLAPYNLDPDQLILKRVMDFFGSILGLILALFITPFLAALIKMESPGPLLFSHIRIGKGGREFKIYKFRSMYVGSEASRHELADQNIHQGPFFKVKNDPRITGVGRVIRKYSLDEFPQFWNVLKGEMSLVGTRPPTREEVGQYKDHHFRRISIKPGLTGIWQISGRSQVRDFDDVVAYDLDYIKNWSLLLDIKIIFRTIGIVLLPSKNDGI
jgi:exopolysaccharide biosynthesis polyprenyl glycosylphosphotransferase